MKKWIITLCVASFIAFPGAAAHLTVSAANDNVGETIGYVVEFNGDIVHVVGEPLDESGFSGAFVQLGNAPVYDLRTGFRVPAEAIQKDMDIRMAYRVPQGANSGSTEPFHAIVAWLNWNEDDAAVFTVEVSENSSYGIEGLVFLSADGKYRIVLTPETLIIDPHYGILSPSEISAGMEFFVWVDILTASTPALVYPEKVVVVY
jgi:hypothetical protein